MQMPTLWAFAVHLLRGGGANGHFRRNVAGSNKKSLNSGHICVYVICAQMTPTNICDRHAPNLQLENTQCARDSDIGMCCAKCAARVSVQTSGVL